MKQAAIIDIGSNSIRYACGYLEQGGRAVMERKQVATTRLGEGLEAGGLLGKVPMLRTIEAIGEFVGQANERGLPLYAYATSAVREGANREEFCGRVKALGIDSLQVLSGEEEARLAHLGATGGEGGVIDIGGGSTQIISSGFAHSGPIGCVRAKDLCDKFKSIDEMRAIIYARCRELLCFPEDKSVSYTGLGGTISTLAALTLGLEAYDEEKVCEARIQPAGLEALVAALFERGSAGRQSHPLLAARAETILPGALILSFVLGRLGVEELTVSDRDGMEGYLLQMLSI